MRTATKKLDVDFIGAQGKPLTKEEQHSVSAFIKKLKEERSRTDKRKSKKYAKQSV